MNVFTILLIAGAVGSVWGKPEVEESNATFSCRELELHFNTDCINIWSHQNKNFAYINGVKNACFPPCASIGDGLMTLDSCVDVDHKEVCTDQNNVGTEKTIHYRGQPSEGSAAAGRHGSGLLLLLLPLAALSGRLLFAW